MYFYFYKRTSPSPAWQAGDPMLTCRARGCLPGGAPISGGHALALLPPRLLADNLTEEQFPARLRPRRAQATIGSAGGGLGLLPELPVVEGSSIPHHGGDGPWRNRGSRGRAIC